MHFYALLNLLCVHFYVFNSSICKNFPFFIHNIRICNNKMARVFYNYTPSNQFCLIGNRFAVFGIQRYRHTKSLLRQFLRPQRTKPHLIKHRRNHAAMHTSGITLMLFFVAKHRHHTAIFHVVKWCIHAVFIIQPANHTHSAVFLFAKYLHAVLLVLSILFKFLSVFCLLIV